MQYLQPAEQKKERSCLDNKNCSSTSIWCANWLPFRWMEITSVRAHGKYSWNI
jgi:hypothetical protein